MKRYRLATAVPVPLEAFSQEVRAALQRHTARPQGSPCLCAQSDICTYTDTRPHTHTNTFESTTNSHIHTKMHTAWLWNRTHQHTPSNRHFSLRCTVLIDSTWQSLSAGREVRSGGKEKHIGVVSMRKLKDAWQKKRTSKSLFSGCLVSSNMVQ